MENFFKTLKDARNTAHLTQAEKARVISAIYQQSPVAQPEPSLYQTSLRSFSIFSRKTVSVTLLVLLTGGIGFSAAADNSLPNSALYPIKIKITEPAQDLIKVTTSAKIDWEIKKTERRFSEAAELARHGQLTHDLEIELADKITEHVEKASKTAEENITDVSEKLSLATELKTVVQVEAQKLQTITESIPDVVVPVEAAAEPVHTTDTPAVTAPESPKPLTSDSTTSIFAVAQELVSDISDQQTTHIEEIAKTDPTGAAEIEVELFAKEFGLLEKTVQENISDAKMQIATLSLLESFNKPVPVTTPEVATVSEIPTEVPAVTVEATNDTLPATEQAVTVITTPTITPLSELYQLQFNTLLEMHTAIIASHPSAESVSELKSLSAKLQTFVHDIEQIILQQQLPEPVVTAPVAAPVDTPTTTIDTVSIQ